VLLAAPKTSVPTGLGNQPLPGAFKGEMMDDATRKQVITAYQTSSNSIQDIARIYKVDVHEVLEVIGEGDMSTVHTPGDLVDPSELGPGDAQINYGKDITVPISLN
jgi:hypothetical protein